MVNSFVKHSEIVFPAISKLVVGLCHVAQKISLHLSISRGQRFKFFVTFTSGCCVFKGFFYFIFLVVLLLDVLYNITA
jgi:hypothetical protein